MRVRLLLVVVLALWPAAASAHPFGIPPLAEVVTAGTNARTTLTLAADDTMILLQQVGAETLTDPSVAAYLTGRYALAVPEGPCTATLSGAQSFGPGTRFFLDHACPAPATSRLEVRGELLRDVSPDYRLVVRARSGARRGEATLERGQSSASLTLAVPPPATTPEPAREPAASEGLGRLFSFLDDGRGPGAVAGALALAAALGALHGLTPGHGKTLVAAYLAGSEARVRHAFAVGGALTVTHTAAVLVLGVLALLAGNAFVPARVEPVLQAAAAGIVLALGAWLLVRRIRTLRSGHDPHVHSHALAADRAMSGRGILAVGLAGGVVPCPEAFGLLFVALGLGRVGAGLLLLVAFSLGLAAVLVAVSLALVVSRKAVAPRLERSRAVRYLPVASAVLVCGIGVALAVSAARQF